MSRGENRPSLSASQYSTSQKSFDIISKAVTKIVESTDIQGGASHEGEVALPLKPYDTTQKKELTCRDNDEETVVSTSCVSPASHPHPKQKEGDQTRQSVASEKFDTRGAANWLRQFLRHSEPGSPNLTQLPEKSHPRHKEHHDYPTDETSMMISKVTTFSEENEADVGTMDTAMHELERLLSEALVLANKVTEQDHCQHDDDLLDSKSTS